MCSVREGLQWARIVAHAEEVLRAEIARRGELFIRRPLQSSMQQEPKILAPVAGLLAALGLVFYFVAPGAPAERVPAEAKLEALAQSQIPADLVNLECNRFQCEVKLSGAKPVEVSRSRTGFFGRTGEARPFAWPGDGYSLRRVRRPAAPYQLSLGRFDDSIVPADEAAKLLVEDVQWAVSEARERLTSADEEHARQQSNRDSYR